MKLSEAVKQVIALAAAIQQYWDTELPKRHRDYPFVSPGEDSGPPPPEENQLRDLLASLPVDVLQQLVLLVYLGRGDFGTDDLAGRYESLKGRFAQPERAVLQLMSQASLADYLTDGLAELGKHGIDVDQLALTSVSSGG
jgi:hypothetical protein